MNKKFKLRKLALVLLPLMVGTTLAAYNDDQELSNQGRMAMSGGSISGEQSLAAPTKTTAQKSNSTAATQKTGKLGFGYDPIFIPTGFTRSFAEFDSDEKNKISHRGRALQKFIQYLTENEDVL